MKLSLVIPCYNEPKTIQDIVARVFAAALSPQWQREVIVVDDGSGEETKAALHIVAKMYPEVRILTRAKNGGKGAALKDGFSIATGDYIVIQDADLEYDPNDIAKLLEPIDSSKAEVVFGSRQIAHNNVSGRLHYYWGGRLVNAVFNLCFGTHLTDLTTCYKVFPRSYIPELIRQPADDFVFDGVELSHVITRGFFVEVPITYHARSSEEGKKLRVLDGIHFLLRMGTLRLGAHMRIMRFGMAGGTAMLVNIGVLYVLTDVFGVWYVASEVAAFTTALLYNFALQRWWTFGGSQGSVAHQGLWFIGLNLINLLLNTALLYVCVEFFGLWYIFAQIIVATLIAFESFFAYRMIFR